MEGYIGLQLQTSNSQNIPTNVVRTPGQPTLVDVASRWAGVHDAELGRGRDRDQLPKRSVRGGPRPDRDHVAKRETSLVQPWPNGPVCAEGTFDTVPVEAGAGV